MDDKELIEKIKELKQIRPRENWVFSTKERIFRYQPRYESNILSSFKEVFQLKFAVPTILILIGGVVMMAQNSLPGDALYSVKKASEGMKVAFTGQDKSIAYLDSADTRVKELNQIAQTNQTAKLPVALQESDNAIKKAATNISAKADTDKDNSQQVAQVVKKVIDINQGLNKVENKLQINMSDKKLLADKASNLVQKEANNSTSSYSRARYWAQIAQTVKEEIKSMEKTTLTKDGEKRLNLAKKYYNKYKKGKTEDRYTNLSKAVQVLLIGK